MDVDIYTEPALIPLLLWGAVLCPFLKLIGVLFLALFIGEILFIGYLVNLEAYPLRIDDDALLANPEFVHLARDILGHAVALTVVCRLPRFGEKQNAGLEGKDYPGQVQEPVYHLDKEDSLLNLNLRIKAIHYEGVVAQPTNDQEKAEEVKEHEIDESVPLAASVARAAATAQT